MNPMQKVSQSRKIGYYAYCLQCCGGGKVLCRPTSKKVANMEATSHMNAYGCKVVIHYGTAA